MMLDRYTAAEVTSVEEVEGWLQSDYPGARCRTASRQGFSYRINAARLPRLGLVFSSCSTASDATLPPASFVRQIFPLASPGQLAVGRHVTCDVTQAGNLIPPDEVMQISHGDNYQQLAVRIEPGVLNASLASLIDMPAQPLAFDFGDTRDLQRARFLRHAAINLAEEINFFGSHIESATLAELEQSLIVRFLFCTEHNHSAALRKNPATASVSTVTRAESYIRENWRDPLDFEKLSRATDTSIRSLYRTFTQTRDYTPSEYAKRVRLEYARAMILRADDTSIMAIALKCGFHNIGRFAQDYHRRFGELPSQTRRRSR